jgi:flagellar biosynthesis/type III secretory pathway chaperone
MSAAERLASLDQIEATELCRKTGEVLDELVEVMNAETTLLRAHRYKDASELSGHKTQLAQDYVGLARAVQRRLPALGTTDNEAVEALARRHEALATQMAENLRVIATARTVTEKLLTDVASHTGAQARPKVYGANGVVNPYAGNTQRGIAVNRAL